MNVCNQRNGDLLLDGGNQTYRFKCWNSRPDDLTAGLFQCNCLCNIPGNILRRNIQHGLDINMRSVEHTVSDFDRSYSLIAFSPYF